MSLKNNWLFLQYALQCGLLLFCTQVNGQPLDIAKLANEPIGMTGKLRFASSQECPDANFETIIKCNALQYAQQDELNFGFLNEKHW